MRAILFAAAVSALVGAGLVYRFFPRTITLPAEVRTEVVTKTVTVTKEKIVQPDGTVIIREVATENNSSATATKTVEKALPGWSLGLAYRPDLSRVLSHQVDAWELSAGRRLVGDVWLTGAVNPLRREVSLGIAYQF
jgi:hypothetical protein